MAACISVENFTTLKDRKKEIGGEAAEMLGLTRIEFLDLLRRSGVGFLVELDEDDCEQLRRARDARRPQSG